MRSIHMSHCQHWSYRVLGVRSHHFHYGYFMYAAAALGRHDAAWLAANAVSCCWPYAMCGASFVICLLVCLATARATEATA